MERSAGGGWGVGVVGSTAIGLEEKDLVVVVDGGAGNVGEDGVGSGSVLERDVKCRIRHDERRDESFWNRSSVSEICTNWEWSIWRQRPVVLYCLLRWDGRNPLDCASTCSNPSKQYVPTKMRVCKKNWKQGCGEEESQSHARPIYSEATSSEEVEAI